MDKEQHLEYYEQLKYLAKTEPKERHKPREGAFYFGLYLSNAELADRYKDKLVSKGWVE